jgi:hypothetical protein
MLFYTYLYLRYDGTPEYVGKGVGDRAFRNWYHRIKPPKDRRFIIVQHHESEADAFEAEKFLISYYGRKDTGTGCLRNLTDGGEGLSGHKHSEQSKAKMREHVRTDEHRKNLSSALKGRIFSNELCRKISMRTKGKVFSKEILRKAAEANQRTYCLRGHRRAPNNLTKNRTCKQCAALRQKSLRGPRKKRVMTDAMLAQLAAARRIEMQRRANQFQ